MDLKALASTSMASSQRQRVVKTLCVATAIVVALMVSWVSYALAATPSFPDVPSNHPYYTAITDLAGRGVINGHTDGSFRPADRIIRQQFAKMIVLSAGYPVSENDICPFLDVVIGGPSSFYPDNYVAVAAKRGLTVGRTPTTFEPYAFVTRYQVISMVVRMLDNLQPTSLLAPPAGWKGSAGWENDPIHGANATRAEYNGLLAGLSLATLNAYGDMNRGEAAQVLHNALTKLVPVSTTTTSAPTSTTGAVTTTTVASTTTTAAATTTTAVTTASTTTTTAPPAANYSIAGLEPAQIVVTVEDQFGNAMPLQMVTLNSTALEGQLTNIMNSVVIGPTDAFGNVAYSWTQVAGDWGVEQVTAAVGASIVKATLIQWIYNDISTDRVSASAGQQKVSVAAGFAPWNGHQLKAYLGTSGSAIGSGTYVSSTGLLMTTGHIWSAGEAFFVGATSTNTDNKPNWMYNLAQ
jgi:hypothetical protein